MHICGLVLSAARAVTHTHTHTHTCVTLIRFSCLAVSSVELPVTLTLCNAAKVTAAHTALISCRGIGIGNGNGPGNGSVISNAASCQLSYLVT